MKQVIVPEELFNQVVAYLLSRPCSETLTYVNELSAKAQLADITITNNDPAPVAPEAPLAN